MDFNDLWFNHAMLMAKKSKDPRTKVGAVIVDPNTNSIVSSGYNGPVRGWDDRELENDPQFMPLTKERKNLLCEHAERNAIYNAARLGNKTEDCDIYITLTPCHECCRAIIQSGIKKVRVPRQFATPFSMFLVSGLLEYEFVQKIEWQFDSILMDDEVVKLIHDTTALEQVFREDL